MAERTIVVFGATGSQVSFTEGEPERMCATWCILHLHSTA
jgi:hypothetical protein